MTIVIVRFDAPLVSFGGPTIDQNGVVQTFPALSMLTGLVANALGWEHRDAEKLESLQARLRYAARIDREGEPLLDYQTVDLGQDWMRPERVGWTTRGHVAERGGANATDTHQRYRHYRADSVCTVALTVVDDAPPSAETIAQALREPARPLFIGRKCCLPAAPLLLGVVDGTSLLAALAATPRSPRADDGALRAAWWDEDDQEDGEVVERSTVVPVSDERDWTNGVHVGRRLVRHGRLTPPEAGHV